MKLTKAEYDALPASMKKMFQADGDDYVATFQTDAEVAGLKSAHEKNKEELRTIKEELKAIRDAKAKDDDEGIRKKGDIEALEKSWQAKLDKALADKDALISKRDSALKEILVTSEARKLASELSTHPHLVEHFITQRLAADFDGDMPKTRILGADGKPSAATFDDLKKEFLADKRFEGILIGSQGSGGGAGGTKPGAGGFKLDVYKNTDGSINWSKVNTERATNPAIVEQVQTALTESVSAQ